MKCGRKTDKGRPHIWRHLSLLPIFFEQWFTTFARQLFFSLLCCKTWRSCVPVCNQDWRNQQLLYYSIVFYNSSIPITVFTIIWVFLWLVKCLMETHWTIDISIVPEHVNNLDDSSFFNGRSTGGRAQNERRKIHVFESVKVSFLKTQQKDQRQEW